VTDFLLHRATGTATKGDGIHTRLEGQLVTGHPPDSLDQAR
jgi:hypothetical protein